MKKRINLSQPLIAMDGTVLKDGDKDAIIKNYLLTYIRQSQNMGLEDSKHNTAYVIGVLIAQNDGTVELTSEQYNVIKKLADGGKFKSHDGKEMYIFDFETRMKICEIVDMAETVNDQSATDTDKAE